jgi:hypothetical protein
MSFRKPFLLGLRTARQSKSLLRRALRAIQRLVGNTLIMEHRSSAHGPPSTMVARVSTRTRTLAWLVQWRHTLNRLPCTDSQMRIRLRQCSTQRARWCRIMGFVFPLRTNGLVHGSRTSTNSLFCADVLRSPTVRSHVPDARPIRPSPIQPTSRGGTADGDEPTWYSCTAPLCEPVSLDFGRTLLRIFFCFRTRHRFRTRQER